MKIKDCYIEFNCLTYIAITEIYNVTFSHSVSKHLPHSEIMKQLNDKAKLIDEQVKKFNTCNYLYYM